MKFFVITMSKEDELQKKIIQFQILESTFRVFQERLESFSQTLEDMLKTKAALEEFDLKKSSNALISIGSGNFVFGKVDDSQDVVVSIGGGVAIKKKKADAINILDGRIKENEKLMQDAGEKASNIYMQLQKLEVDIGKMQE